MTTTVNAVEVGWDTETHLIAAEQLAPRIVCLTQACGTAENMETGINVRADGMEKIEEAAVILFSEGITSIAHNAAFDLAVMAANFPNLVSTIFEAVGSGRAKDTRIREKLLALTTTGNIDFIEVPGEKPVKAQYSLAYLVKFYFGVDLTALKQGQDTWRLNYNALDDVPGDKWPKDATEYAIEDSIWALLVYREQEKRRAQIIAERGIDPFKTEDFQVACDFVLRLMSCWGMMVDPQRKAALVERLNSELVPEKHMLLIETGILRPAEPPRPHKKNPAKMTKGEPESINQTKLKAFVEQLEKDFPDQVTIKRTDPSEKFPQGQISTDAEWLDDHAHLSPVLEQYQHRQSLQKLVNTELPRMCVRDRDGNPLGDAIVVHPLYDVLKRTGRTSSFADDMVPSFNCQNVHSGIKNPDGSRMDVRGCFIPRPGSLLFSIDYSYMELCTLAQKCLDLFGQSVLADVINAGLDPHAWLGAQLCYAMDQDFRDSVADNMKHGTIPNERTSVANDPYFLLFMQFKACGIPEWEATFKHFRKLAKPTGLGYPGGLGPKTFIKYAKATYGEVVSIETATALRDGWRAAFPEMPRYFEWITQCCVDPFNKVRLREFKDEEGRKQTREVEVFAYTSPMGMYRAGCDYCAAANGAALQTPSAEGAKLAVWTVGRAAFDPAMQSPIYGAVRPICFVHDEIIGEVLDNGHAPEYLSITADLMVEAFRQATPGIKVKAQPVLMRRWDKDAEPVYGADKRLTVWEPKAK